MDKLDSVLRSQHSALATVKSSRLKTQILGDWRFGIWDNTFATVLSKSNGKFWNSLSPSNSGNVFQPLLHPQNIGAWKFSEIPLSASPDSRKTLVPGNLVVLFYSFLGNKTVESVGRAPHVGPKPPFWRLAISNYLSSISFFSFKFAVNSIWINKTSQDSLQDQMLPFPQTFYCSYLWKLMTPDFSHKGINGLILILQRKKLVSVIFWSCPNSEFPWIATFVFPHIVFVIISLIELIKDVFSFMGILCFILVSLKKKKYDLVVG